ncbi:PfkB family carbohydrate kinase, partial [Lysinibacillus sp. D3C2_S12]|uniref:PfkB family carbohydrate kinase n=1 Tax=Lysinibacillus sp. D3C2_S12 TaxID=2941226 RepID=UPI0020BE0C29
CKGEDKLWNPGNTDATIQHLLPLAAVTTPNLFEAGQLAGTGTTKTIDEMKTAARKIHKLVAKAVVIKGGKALATEKATDLFFDGKIFFLLESEKVASTNNHGAGCTFAASVTANPANGLSIKAAVI